MESPTSERELTQSERRRLERKARRHETRRALIVGAARQILERGGIENFSVNAVAAAADLSKPAVYYYFASKEILVQELAARERLEEAEELGDALRIDRGGVAALETFVRAYVSRYASDWDRFRIGYLWPQVLGVGAEVSGGEIQRRSEQVDTLLTNRLAADQAAGRLPQSADAGGLTSLVRAAAHGIVAQSSACNKDDDEARGRAQVQADALCNQVKRLFGFALS